MGYRVDQIGAETRLYSIIGVNAIENKKEGFFNSYFQEMDVDCRVMPLNIREDDFGFFLNGLKDSKIKGVYLEREFWSKSYDLLPIDSEEINFSKMVDTIDIVDGKYLLRAVIGEAISHIVGEAEGKEVVIVGSSPVARSYLYRLINQNPAKIIFADEVVENMIELMELVPKGLEQDIVRVERGDSFEEDKLILNFSNIETNSILDINRDFDKILKVIAKINTKRWSEHG